MTLNYKSSMARLSDIPRNNAIHQDIAIKLCGLLRHIEVELSRDWSLDNIGDSLSIEALAQRMNMSVRSLTSYFKLYTGESLGKYIASRRAKYAARLFRLFPDASTAEVSRLNGFFNPPALYSFLKKYGINKPSDLRKPSTNCTKVIYRREQIDKCICAFKLRFGEYNDCNSVEFEEDNWQAIESSIHDALPIGYIGIAIDNYLTDDINSGAFMAGVLYNSAIKVPKEFGLRIMNKGKYAVFTHIGPYSLLPDFYNSVIATIRHSTDLIVEIAAPFFEKYLNSPTDTEAEELITELWIPLKK